MAAPDILRSTREERQAYIDAVFRCRADCDSCGICQVFKGKEPLLVFADYIDGKRSYREISEEQR